MGFAYNQDIAIAANAKSAGAQVVHGTGPVSMACQVGFSAVDAVAAPSIGSPAMNGMKFG